MGGESVWGSADGGTDADADSAAIGADGAGALTGGGGRTLTLDGGGSVVHVESSLSRASLSAPAVSPAVRFAEERHAHMLTMPKTAEYTKFLIPPRAKNGIWSVTGDWVYGHHVAAATKNADGSYNIAGRSLTEYQFNNMRARLSDVREKYEHQMNLWESSGRIKGHLQ